MGEVGSKRHHDGESLTTIQVNISKPVRNAEGFLRLLLPGTCFGARIRMVEDHEGDRR
jgi:hypothetical protein